MKVYKNEIDSKQKKFLNSYNFQMLSLFERKKVFEKIKKEDHKK